MLRLRTLGGFAVYDSSGAKTPFPAHRLALLALLAAAGERGMARDVCAALARHVRPDQTSRRPIFTRWRSSSRKSTRLLQVAPTNTERWGAGIQRPLRDFEDAMQVADEHACGADLIATRKPRDFLEFPIPALAPAGILSRLV